MSSVSTKAKRTFDDPNNPQEDRAYKQGLARRKQVGRVWATFFFAANVIALLALLSLLVHITNQAIGYVVIRNVVQPETLTGGVPLNELDEPALVNILLENNANLRVLIRDTLSAVPNNEFTTRPVREVLRGRTYDEAWDDLTINQLNADQHAQILSDNHSRNTVEDFVTDQIVRPNVVRTWNLIPSLTQRAAIAAQVAEQYPGDRLAFYSWVNWDFLTSNSTSNPTTTGLLTALIGSGWIMLVTTLTALPLGVAAAIYLEEYATDNWFNNLIEINIRNLAAIPSVIYGLLGVAVFVFGLTQFTSGAVFGAQAGQNPNGRTVLSAGLTLALLILPVLIVNAQEAIRAVPRSIREASYGLGATKWQTVSRQVMPSAMPGILTGLILSISRAVGETAPLLVVGASTFVGTNPNGLFSRFTVVPIQIYSWTAQPSDVYRSVAAAAILVLLLGILMFNMTAIILRNRFSRRI